MKYQAPVSVVMPCYNCGKYVADAMESILKQSFSGFEFIVVNDGSTDNSHAIITAYNDKRIKYIRLNHNTGNYAARNTGMRAATGKYICVMDADDIADPGRLRVQFQYLEAHPKIGVLGTRGEFINEHGEPLGKEVIKPICSPGLLKVFLLRNNYMLHPSLMFRSSLLGKHNLFYDESYQYASDYDFVFRSSLYTSVKNIDMLLIKYRIHSQQISSAKFEEQRKCADHIRTKMIKRLIPDINDCDLKIYLKIIGNTLYLTTTEVASGLKVLNKVLDSNSTLKYYNSKMLYELFDYLLSKTATQTPNVHS